MWSSRQQCLWGFATRVSTIAVPGTRDYYVTPNYIRICILKCTAVRHTRICGQPRKIVVFAAKPRNRANARTRQPPKAALKHARPPKAPRKRATCGVANANTRTRGLLNSVVCSRSTRTREHVAEQHVLCTVRRSVVMCSQFEIMCSHGLQETSDVTLSQTHSNVIF